VETPIYVAILGLTVGVALYRSRHEEPWRIVAALVGALVLVMVMVTALAWAGIDLGRLYVLLAPMVAVAFIAFFAILLRLAAGRHGAPTPKSPYDFS
jgi:hypothetical protein